MARSFRLARDYPAGVPQWSTPEWRSDRPVDPLVVLDALDAVNAVLTEIQATYQSHVDIRWEEGSAEEQTTDKARERLRFAAPPRRVKAVSMFAPQTDVTAQLDHWVGFDLRPGVVEVDVRAQDFDLARRLLEVGRAVIEGADPIPRPASWPYIIAQPAPPIERAEPPPAKPLPERLSTSPVIRTRPARVRGRAAPAKSGARAWMNDNQGLLAAIGIGVAVVLGVLALISA
jgi:hypothetical protein